MKNIKLALLFGGPSPERGISLNSARTVCDHLEGDGIEIVPIYFDLKARPFTLGREWLYCNTPADFDFKLAKAAKPLSAAKLQRVLRGCDVAFPVIHGVFGDDGQVQKILESAKIPFVGSSSESCELAYDKGTAQALLKAYGYANTGGIVADSVPGARDAYKKLKQKQVVIKPTRGGSSLGVCFASTMEKVELGTKALLKRYRQVIIEPRLQGREFTAVVTQDGNYEPVCLIPIEVQTDGDFFDYRKKYLATRQAVYHCPPRFSDKLISQIRAQAQAMFKLFGLRDVARFDGWILSNGKILFSDFNPISGMEQNSFLFIQAARLGISHRQFLRFLVKRALARGNKSLPNSDLSPEVNRRSKKRTIVPVLFGGDTAERQVSVMSGTNAWLKLTRSQRYIPEPYFLDQKRNVWRLPYACALNHTAEDISEACKRAVQDGKRMSKLATPILRALKWKPEKLVVPKRESLNSFLKGRRFVFLGLHGGFGEGGALQAKLESKGINFNGPGSRAAKLCMDKFETAKAIIDLGLKGVGVTPKAPVALKLLAGFSKPELDVVWDEITQAFGKTILVKPADDGCSAGVVVLNSSAELAIYIKGLQQKLTRFESGTFAAHAAPIELPSMQPHELLFERFIVTDRLEDKGNKLLLHKRSGWVEITIGVIGALGKMTALSPSVTVAHGDVLSVEEKFQGGTGINLTPPPPLVMSSSVIKKIQKRIAAVANGLGLAGYSRIDAFVERRSGELMIIEVNSLPALTPSTVLFHQGLAESPKLYPRAMLEKIIDLGQHRRNA